MDAYRDGCAGCPYSRSSAAEKWIADMDLKAALADTWSIQWHELGLTVGDMLLYERAKSERKAAGHERIAAAWRRGKGPQAVVEVGA
jgi:hypothetical protein